MVFNWFRKSCWNLLSCFLYSCLCSAFYETKQKSRQKHERSWSYLCDWIYHVFSGWSLGCLDSSWKRLFKHFCWLLSKRMDNFDCGSKLSHKRCEYFPFKHFSGKNKGTWTHFWVSFKQTFHYLYDFVHDSSYNVQHFESKNSSFNSDGIGWSIYLLLLHLPISHFYSLQMLVPTKKTGLNSHIVDDVRLRRIGRQIMQP